MFSRWDRKILFALAPLVLLHQCITSSLHCSARQPTSSPQVNVHLKHLQLTPTEVSAASNASRSKQVRSNEQAAGPFLGGFNWVTGKLAIWEDSGARIYKTVAWLLLCIWLTFACLLLCIFVFCTFLVCTLFALPHCLLSGYSKHTTLSFLGSIIQVSHELRLGPPLFKTIDLWGEHIWSYWL